MKSLYDNFQQHPQYSGWVNVSEIATARLPYALFGPTIITHIPFFRTSREDANFQRHVRHFSEFLADNQYIYFSAIRPGSSINKAKYQAESHLAASTLDEAIIQIWRASRDALLQTEKTRPELFVFQAITSINLDINRKTHNTIVQLLRDRTSPWNNDVLRKHAFELTNDVLNVFLREVATFIELYNKPKPKRLAKDASTIDASSDVVLDEPKPTEGLGGLISWFEISDDLESKHRILGTNQGNRKLFALAPPTLDPNSRSKLLDRYFLWRRGDRNWRYTFFEGSAKYPTRDRDTTEDGAADLEFFLKKLFASKSLEDSFPNLDLDVFRDNRQAIEYPFPGTRTAGAQYFVIPSELLLLIVEHIRSLSALYLPESEPKYHFTPEISEIYDGIKKQLRELEETLLETEINASRDVWRPLPDLLRDSSSDIESLLSAVGDLRERIDLIHKKILEGILADKEDAKERAQKFFNCFAALAEQLWKVIYVSNEFKLGYDDFVASTVIDGRAIYFSNFRPYQLNGFTRTFFVDFHLAPYQRGRLVRRLCEVATHRMACVVDFDRFDALQDGINTLNNKFNALAVQRLAHPQDIEMIQISMENILDLYQSASQFNIFITEGVLGRKRAIEAGWENIKRQVSDVREGRIGGYAMLGDFLERGLALSILDVGRVADRYDNLLTRIRDHLSTIRTDLTATHALKITETMKSYLRIALDTENLTTKLTTQTANLISQTNETIKLTGVLEKQAREHTKLLTGADLLVWVGSTYYITGLLDDLLFKPFGDWTGNWHLGVRLISILAAFAFVAFAYWKLTGRAIWASLRLHRRTKISSDKSDAESTQPHGLPNPETTESSS